MPKFNNFSALSHYLMSTNNGRVKMNQIIAQLLREEVRRLEAYIKENINDYLNSYQPDVYDRTGNLLRSIRVGNPKATPDGVIVEIYFDRMLALHPSVMGPNQPPGYVPWLIEVGWDIRDKVPFDRYNFTHFEGIHYVLNAIKRFEATNKYGIKVAAYIGNLQYYP